METRETLEAALAASWDRDTLTVYADHLQAEGDPRGELIALDLQIEASGNNVELSKRRTSLLYAWLGGLVPVDNVHASWVGDSLRFGFVEELVFSGAQASAVSRLEQALESAAGPYVRALSMIGTAPELEAALSVISRYEHRWLTHLTITGYHQTPVTPAIVADAFRAMPRLHTLELHQPPAFAAFSHPSIKKLVIRGREVYTAIGDDATFDAVTELVLDMRRMYFDEVYGEEYEAEPPEPEPPLPRVGFPALRRLDLTRMELEAALELVAKFDARAHVTTLAIPHLRSASDMTELRAAIRDMAALETVEIAHGSYYEPPDLPKVTLVRAERWAWPTQDLAQGRGLRIYMPLAKYGDTVALIDAIYVMEQSYETLPAAARDAWSQLWRFVAELGTTAQPFPARVLADAVDAFPGLMQNGWRELREELSARRPLAADAMLKIERCTI